MPGKTRKIGALLVAGALSALFGFAVHLFSSEIVTPYVASVMAGRQVTPSWDVRIPAALSSIEQGIALGLVYLAVRACLPGIGTVRRGLLVGLLALALSGSLVRQPLMNLLIGNPPAVVAAQDGVTWFIWLAMGLIVAACLDLLMPRAGPRTP